MEKDILTKLVAASAIAALAGSTLSPTIASAQTAQAPASGKPATAATDLVATLQQVCLPVLRGGDVKSSARAVGFTQKDGQWVLKIGGDERIELAPPDATNPHLCSATIYAQPGETAALQQALNAWAGAQNPAITPVKLDATVAGVANWTTSTWSAQTPSGTLSLALGQQQPAPGTATTLTEFDLQVSLTPA